MLRAALISSLLGVGTELVSGGDSELLQVLRAGAQDGTNEAERRVVERELSIPPTRSEEHTSELQSLMRISYAVFCLKKKKQQKQKGHKNEHKTQNKLKKTSKI